MGLVGRWSAAMSLQNRRFKMTGSSLKINRSYGGAKRNLSRTLDATSNGLMCQEGPIGSRYDEEQIVEKRWQQFFSAPSEWWDHRSGKRNAMYPDFKHKRTKEALWLNSKLNPGWVGAELAALTPGVVQRNLFSWNSMLVGSVKDGQNEKTLQLFQQMQQEGINPDKFTFVPVLNACARLGALEVGRCIHTAITQSKCDSDVFVCSSLVDMYAKCGSIEDGRRVFNKMHTRNVVVWTALIQGYVKCGQGKKALELFRQMQSEGVEPHSVTFVGVINACASIAALEEGRDVHTQAIQSGCELNVFVNNSLIDMYTKCGSIEDAQSVFNNMQTRNVVTWTSMIQGYVRCGQGQKAVELYHQMEGKAVKPDLVTFVGILNACACEGALEEGTHVHAQIIASGNELDVFVSNSLVDMYAKCGSIEDGHRVFNKMVTKDLIAWNILIQGYVKYGLPQKALELYRQMQDEGVEPDDVTFVGVLNTCASVVALEEGRRVHEHVIRCGHEYNVIVGNSLIDMYAKCGSIEDARRVFGKMLSRNMVTWTVMLQGYAMHGNAKEALQLFGRMCEEDVAIDGVTFICLLSACSHAGLVDEGLKYFESMTSVYGILATWEHYACVVDLLGRAGHLHEAEIIIKTMPCESHVTVWKALLGACRVHGNVQMGEYIAEQVLELDPGNASGYVLLSNIYAAAGKWDRRENVQRLRMERGVKKQPGCTWIEVDNQVHSFVVDDQVHPRIMEIHAELKRLLEQMEEAGYVPDTDFVLHDVDEEEKVLRLCYHS